METSEQPRAPNRVEEKAATVTVGTSTGMHTSSIESENDGSDGDPHISDYPTRDAKAPNDSSLDAKEKARNPNPCPNRHASQPVSVDPLSPDNRDAYIGNDIDDTTSQEESVVLPMPRLLRQQHRTPSTPANSELLQPRQRVMKVQPEVGSPYPGAYAARQSRIIIPIPENQVEENDTISHFSYLSTEEGTATSASHDTSVPAETQTIEISGLETPSLFSSDHDDPLGNSQIHESPCRYVEERLDEPEGANTNKRNLHCAICVGVTVLLITVIGVATGVTLAATNQAPAPSPLPSCSLEAIFEECSTPDSFTFQSEVPSCVMEQYESLRETYHHKFRIDAPDKASCAPENLALLSTALHTTEDTPEAAWSNRFGLSALYFATGQNAVLEQVGWTTEAPYCEWGKGLKHVACESTAESDHVTAINLSESSLKGTLPLNLPLFLPLLQILDVDNNQLSGNLPPDLAVLSHLYAKGNILNGTIPSSFISSTTLAHLTVSGNSNLVISRDQPFFSGTQLRSLDISGVQFQRGTFPTEILKLTNLVSLVMGENELTGTLPSDILRLTALTDLKLFGNTMNGTVPSELATVESLSLLHLDENDFSGSIPFELGSMTNLVELRLNYNKLNGTIPSELGHLTKLQYLSVQLNDLTGTMPTEIGLLTELRSLLFEDNNLDGTIPKEVCSLKINSNVMSEFSIENEHVLDSNGYGGLVCPDEMPECCEPMSL